MHQVIAMPRLRHLFSTVARIGGFAVALAVLTLGAALLGGCGEPSVQNAGASASVASSQAGEPGRNLFVANCAACHGASGEGQPDWHISKPDGTLPAPPLNGDGHTWHHADGFLYQVVDEGGKFQEDPRVPGFKSAMPGFGDRLSHQEIVAVLTYVKTLWGDKTRGGFSILESQAIISRNDPFPSG